MEDPPGIKHRNAVSGLIRSPGAFWQLWSSLAPTGHQRTSGYEKAQRDGVPRLFSDGRALVEVVKWGGCRGAKEPPGINPHRGAHSRIPATDDD
jgi:hypothetical protein